MARREHYLEALGIELWAARAGVAAAARGATAAVDSASIASVAQPEASVPGPQRESATTIEWSRLEAQVRSCTLCGLAASRTQTVFGVGNREADLMVIGEAPGADEDRKGEPFVGRAGQLLNAMLRALGSPRESVFIANVLKCRPPNNRDPEPDEVACCIGYLQRQVALVKPKLLLAVGRIAAQNLLATDTPIGKLRGSVHRFGAEATPLIVTYHPAYLLRSPGEKRRAWQDLKFVRAELRRSRAAAS